jgi:CheY-like chemotaxis protein
MLYTINLPTVLKKVSSTVMQEPHPDILVVDDERPIREMLSEILTDEGYQVVTARDGREAMTYLQQNRAVPKLILLDINMPTMPGPEFRRRQQQDARLQTIPVVVISASSTIMQQRANLAADAYLPKPIDYDELIETAQRYCST